MNYLDCTPLRSAKLAWRTKDDGTVEIDIEHKGFYNFIAQKFFKRPRISHIALDRYGSAVWENIDGNRTVADLADVMKERFPDETDRMTERVVTFTAMLKRNRMIVFDPLKK